MSSLSTNALNLSPEMVFELAMGIDPPYDIAARYGFDAQALDGLMAQGWFQQAVYTRRQQLSDEGQTFPVMADMMARDMWRRLFQQDKIGQLKPTESIEVAKQLSGFAGIASKNAATTAGPGFTITINVPTDRQGPSNYIDVEAEVVSKPAVVLELEPELPPKPEGLRMPDFDLGRAVELVGKPV